MKPYHVTLWVYADSDQEAQSLQNELNDFTMTKYNQGVFVKAKTLQALLQRYGNNAIVNAFLKQ